MVPAAIAGTIIMIKKVQGFKPLFFGILVYGISTVFLFAASSLYHINKKQENENTIWRKLDHLAIFFMIAGTYTPMSMIFLDDPMKTGIIAAQWTLAFLGLVFKLFFINAPRYLSTGIYLAMGWLVLIPVKYFWDAMPERVIFHTALGALAFTLGGIVYAVKKPACRPGVFGFHEIFHVLIILGWFFHYLMVYFSVSSRLQ
jgi:hemolysin III